MINIAHFYLKRFFFALKSAIISKTIRFVDKGYSLYTKLHVIKFHLKKLDESKKSQSRE